MSATLFFSHCNWQGLAASRFFPGERRWPRWDRMMRFRVRQEAYIQFIATLHIFYSELDEFSHVLEQFVPVWFTHELHEKAKWALRYLKKS
jgi:hypothetical protein